MAKAPVTYHLPFTTPTTRGRRTARLGFRLLAALVLLTALLHSAQAQTDTYRLHKEASTTTGLFQLKTAAPDGTSLAIQSANLRNVAAGEYVIKEFDTQ